MSSDSTLVIVEPKSDEEQMERSEASVSKAPPAQRPPPMPEISAEVLMQAVEFVKAHNARIAAGNSVGEADADATVDANSAPRDMIIPLFIYAFAVSVHHTMPPASVVDTSATPQKEGEHEHNKSMDPCSKESNNEYFSATEGTGSSSGFLSAAEGSDSLQDVSNTFGDVKMWAYDRNLAQPGIKTAGEAVSDITEEGAAEADQHRGKL